MKKILLITLLLCSFYGFSQVDDLNKYIENQKRIEDSIKKAKQNEYSSFLMKSQDDYDDYVKKEQEAYNNFIKEREKQWGKGNVKESSQKDWVEYSKDGKSRSIVDFESGEATIELIQEEGKQVDNKVIEEQLKLLLTNKGTTKDYDSEIEKAQPLQDKPVLENQVKTPSGELVTEKNIDKSVKEIVKNIKPEVKTIKGTDNKERQVISIKFELVPDHIRVDAEKYKKEVEKYCNKWGVDPALVYAIMQTESSFNPKAKSHVPAYGLMQIVPKTAGADCAKSLNKPFKIPTSNYLFVPENNIEMGVHYLYLKKNEFSKVTDKNSQTLCVIASYNTGAGNVAKALSGDTKIGKAIPKINDMSYDELFIYFEKNLLPETQKYIRSVTESMHNFKSWLN